MGYTKRVLNEVSERIGRATIQEVDDTVNAYRDHYKYTTHPTYQDEVMSAFLWQYIKEERGDIWG
jgi:hypothetical protein